jgi:hypothetical protein
MLSAAVILAAAALSAVGADDTRVAFAAACEVHAWTPPARVTRRIARMSCPRTSTGSGIPSVSVAGTRVLWLHYVGGNIREWSLWTAKTTNSRPRRLRFVARAVDARPPIVVGEGDVSSLGDLLPYAVDENVIALRSSGSRRFMWKAPAPVAALDAHGGQLAVAAGRLVTVLDAGGRTLATEVFSAPVTAVEVTGDGLLVQYGRTLEWRQTGRARIFTLPLGARLADADGPRAVYISGHIVRILRLDSGRDSAARAGSLAMLESSSLVIARGRSLTVTRLR